MRQLVFRTAVVAVAFVAASAIAWWAVAVAAALFGVLTTRDRGGPLVAGAGAMLAWASLLVYDATRGPVGTVAATVGGVLQMKPVGVYALTLAYAGLIAVCAAVIGRAVARTARPT
jgi:hypothetical protein